MSGSIYEPFDNWLRVPTWSTSHPLDERRFDEALAEVQGLRDFTIEGLRRYILESGKAVDDIWGKDTSAAVDRYLKRAAAQLKPR